MPLVESKKNALYRSEDGGLKWKKINDKSDIGNRPFYYCEIYVDPETKTGYIPYLPSSMFRRMGAKTSNN